MYNSNIQSQPFCRAENTRYTGAAEGILQPIGIARALYPSIRGADLFAYMFQRFGTPNAPYESHRDIARWNITTPLEGLALIVTPYMGAEGWMSFGYLLEYQLTADIMAVEEAPFEEWSKAARKWFHETHPEQIPEPLLTGKIDVPEKGELAWYELGRWAMFHTVEFEGYDGKIELYHPFDSAHKAYPVTYPQRIENWESLPQESLKKQACDAIKATLLDLQRPVFVRDIAINCLGRIEDRDLESFREKFGDF